MNTEDNKDADSGVASLKDKVAVLRVQALKSKIALYRVAAISLAIFVCIATFFTVEVKFVYQPYWVGAFDTIISVGKGSKTELERLGIALPAIAAIMHELYPQVKTGVRHMGDIADDIHIMNNSVGTMGHNIYSLAAHVQVIPGQMGAMNTSMGHVSRDMGSMSNMNPMSMFFGK